MNAPPISDAGMVPVEIEDNEPFIAGEAELAGEGERPAQAPSALRPEGEGQTLVALNLADVSMTSARYAMERVPVEEQAGQSGTDPPGARQQGRLMSTMLAGSLVALLLACLAFFVVILPKTRNRQEQQKRGDV
jgi:hypothetical protein